MACDINQKTMLEQAADFVDCPNSMVPEYKRDAMLLASLSKPSNLSITRQVSVTNAWVALPEDEGREVSILNLTGADLDISTHASNTTFITIPDGTTVSIQVVELASEIKIKAVAGATGVQIIVSK